MVKGACIPILLRRQRGSRAFHIGLFRRQRDTHALRIGRFRRRRGLRGLQARLGRLHRGESAPALGDGQGAFLCRLRRGLQFFNLRLGLLDEGVKHGHLLRILPLLMLPEAKEVGLIRRPPLVEEELVLAEHCRTDAVAPGVVLLVPRIAAALDFRFPGLGQGPFQLLRNQIREGRMARFTGVDAVVGEMARGEKLIVAADVLQAGFRIVRPEQAE